MFFIQLTGLSGAGKSTIANAIKELLVKHKYRTEVIDADVYRKMIRKNQTLSFTGKKQVHESVKNFLILSSMKRITNTCTTNEQTLSFTDLYFTENSYG